MLTSEYLESEITAEPEHCVSGSHTSVFDRVSSSSKLNVFFKKNYNARFRIVLSPTNFQVYTKQFHIAKRKTTHSWKRTILHMRSLHVLSVNCYYAGMVRRLLYISQLFAVRNAF